MTNAYPRGTVEYLIATVSADVPLDAQTVAISMSRGGVHDWKAAQWVGDVGSTRQCRTTQPITFDATFTHNNYSLYVKLTDNPEQPIIPAGDISIYA